MSSSLSSSSSSSIKKYVTLRSMEGDEFTVEEKVVVAMQSPTINNYLAPNTDSHSSSSSDTTIPLPNIKTRTLMVLLAYSTKRANRELIDKRRLVKLMGPLFFDLFAAAKDLDIRGLLLLLYLLAPEVLSPAIYRDVKGMLDAWCLKPPLTVTTTDAPPTNKTDSVVSRKKTPRRRREQKSNPLRKFLGCFFSV